MEERKLERWEELCQQAEKEQNSEKLYELLKGILEEFEEKDRKSKSLKKAA